MTTQWQPPLPPPYPQTAQVQPRKPKRWPVLAGLGVVAVLVVSGVVAVAVNDSGPAAVPTAEVTFVQAIRSMSPPVLGQLTDEQVVTAGRGICTEPSTISRADAAVRLSGSRSVPVGTATTIVATATEHLCPTKTWPAVSAPVATYAAPVPTLPTTGPVKDVSARDWLLIAKDPDAHIGERIAVFGEVTQFDSATGTDSFRANVDGVKHPVKYGYADYETNTVLTANSSDLLAQVVKDDLFRAEVTVAGSYSYTTTMRGSMTVPKLLVTKIEVIGSTA